MLTIYIMLDILFKIHLVLCITSRLYLSRDAFLQKCSLVPGSMNYLVTSESNGNSTQVSWILQSSVVSSFRETKFGDITVSFTRHYVMSILEIN